MCPCGAAGNSALGAPPPPPPELSPAAPRIGATPPATRQAILDAVSGRGVASVGHSHPRWVKAVTAATVRGRLTGASSHTDELIGYLALLAAGLPPPVDRSVLVSTEPEAIETALRLTQTASGRSGVLAFHSGLQSVTNSDVRNASVPLCKDHDALDYETCGESVAEAIAAIAARQDIDEIGTVLVEPVLAAAGNLLPRRGFLAALQSLCRQRGWLLIFDESVTGFGRTGKPFAFETFEVEPDVVVLGKGLGGGFPSSAVCASSALWNASALRTLPMTASSERRRPLACAAGRVALEIVSEPEFLKHVRAVSVRAAQRLRELVMASSRVARPRGIGLMLGFDLIDPRDGSFATAVECEAIFRACRDRGILLAGRAPHIRLTPPLTMSLEEADCLFDRIAETTK